MKKNVTAFLPAAGLDTLDSTTETMITLVTPVATTLDDSQKKGIRTMADGREGYVHTVSRVALAHTEHLPKSDDPTDLSEALVYYNQLESISKKLGKLYELVDETTMALGIDIMAMADRYVAHLQAARKNNAALDDSLNQIDEFNKRFGTPRTGGTGTVPVQSQPGISKE